MSSNVVYAIVKAGGRQEKVSVGDIVVVDKLSTGDAVMAVWMREGRSVSGLGKGKRKIRQESIPQL